MRARIALRSMVLAALLVMVGAAAGLGLHHSISISLFPSDNSLLATDSIYVWPQEIEGGRISFLINHSLVVEDISTGSGTISWYTQEDIDSHTFKDAPDSEDEELIRRAKGVFIEIEQSPPPDEPLIITIAYAGVVYDSLEAPPKAYAKGFAETSGLIDERGVFLTNASLWYPFRFDVMFTFRLQVDVPYPWMSVSQGRRVDEYCGWAHGEDRVFTVWSEGSSTPELYLVAGEYYRHETFQDGVWMMTYTYEPSDSLARVYLEATARYIDMYQRLIGDYPFAKFALVENFWQTGFGMPSFTLLGSRVIRLPFIVHTSYGHEILHNWWGNSVYVDYDSGNWCEGLTTYGADYLYKEQMSESEARDYRHHTLIAFNNYVSEEKDFPLSEFRERHDASSQSVGYGKSLMVYHMLRRSLGDSVFWMALRRFYADSRFRTASWDDVGTAFSRVSGEDFAWYFNQWVNRTGMPTVRLGGAGYEEWDGRYLLSFTLEQDSPVFIIDLPVAIETALGSETRTVRLSGPDSTYDVYIQNQPVAIAIDPDYDTFRKLYLEEIPMTLGSMFGQDSVLAVIGSEETDSTQARLREVADIWGLGGQIIDESELDDAAAATDHIWLLGRGNLMARLTGLRHDAIEIGAGSARVGDSDFQLSGGTLVCALRNPYNEELGLAMVISSDMTSLLSIASRIPHYSRYSYVGFQAGRPTLKGVWKEQESPLKADFRER